MTSDFTAFFSRVLLFAALCFAAAGARSRETDLRLEVSRQWAEKGDYDKAVQELRLYLSEHPDSPEIYARIGSYRMKQGNFKLAGENYKIAITKNPDSREAREGLALAYEKSGDKIHADEERKKLAALKTHSVQASKPPEPARPVPRHTATPPAAPEIPDGQHPGGNGEDLARGVQPAIDPSFSPALDSGTSKGPEGVYTEKDFLDALSLYREGKAEAMAAPLRRCLTKSPGHPGAYYLGGVMRFEKGELGKALFNFKRSTSYPDRGFNSWFYMGRIYQSQERVPEAIAAFEKYLSLSKSETGRRQAEAYLAQLRGADPDEKAVAGKAPAAKGMDKDAAGKWEAHGDESSDAHSATAPKRPAEVAKEANEAKALVLGRDGSFFFLIPDAASPSGKRLSEAYELCKKDKFEKAVNLLKETLLGYGGSDNADAANLDIASAYLRLGLWDLARDRLADYLGEGSRDSVRYYDAAQYLMALAQLGLKDGEKAERALLGIRPSPAGDVRSATPGPTQEEIDFRLTQAAELQKDGKKLSAYLEKSYGSSRDPVRKATLAMRQGLLYSRYGKTDKAMDSFRRSMADCKDPAAGQICGESQLRLADMAFRKKDWKGAMDLYRKFASKYPSHRESDWVHYQMANIYKLTNNFESALNEYKRVIDNYPDSYWASQAKWKREDTIWQKEYEEVLD
ncbi:MAG: tetratricopeptide repeat protein [Fibrobacteria bacterium]